MRAKRRRIERVVVARWDSPVFNEIDNAYRRLAVEGCVMSREERILSPQNGLPEALLLQEPPDLIHKLGFRLGPNSTTVLWRMERTRNVHGPEKHDGPANEVRGPVGVEKVEVVAPSARQ